ncbi:MAG: hypothetical protein HQM04_18000 [Magnetococcales bacterium]|nr:hypothetical protein [Magnetococcales bacterium]MBF0116920.1 hypothetical protein [Magnetococcales bacterium]
MAVEGNDNTSQRNENALLEVGAAYCLDIPVIIVTDSELPSDIRGNLYVDAPKSANKEINYDQLRSILFERMKEAVNYNPRSSKRFIVHGYATRGDVDFFSLIKRCHNRIDLLTTNLGFLVTNEIYEKNNKKYTLLDILATELSKKNEHFKMRILTLDPDSNFTNDRALALEKERREFREHMRDDLETVKKFITSDDFPVMAEMRTYDAFPLQMVYFFDNIVVSSVVSNSRSSRECNTYIHRLNAPNAKNTYEDHFGKLWLQPGTKIFATNRKKTDRKKFWEIIPDQ